MTQFYRYAFPVLLIILAVFASACLAYATPAGLGLTNDSAAYIGGARSILAGTGYSDIWLDSDLEAITHYPPLLSLTLAAIGLFGLDPLRGVRLLNILLFGANTALMGSLGWQMTRSKSLSLLLALLFCLSAPLLGIHAYALSEPLFLFFSLLSFLFFSCSQKTDHPRMGTGWLLIAGLVASLATITRYSGLALVATFALSIVLLQPGWRMRFASLGWFFVGVIPPLAAWFIRNRLVAESATNRSFVFHPVLGEKTEIAIYNLSQWLIPVEAWRRELVKSGWMEWILILLGMILLVWVLFHAWRSFFRPGSGSSYTIAFTTAVYIFGYLGAVLFSMSFFDASTKFQHRILSPIYVSLMVLFVWVIFRITKIFQRAEPAIKNFALFACFSAGFIAIGFSTFGFQLKTLELRDAAGLGYGSWKWRDADVMAELKKLPPDVAIYTNSPPAVYFVTGRASRVIPTSVNPVDNQARSNYQQDMDTMRDEIVSGRAVLAMFDTSAVDDSLAGDNQNEYISGLRLILKAQGDVLYGKP